MGSLSHRSAIQIWLVPVATPQNCMVTTPLLIKTDYVRFLKYWRNQNLFWNPLLRNSFLAPLSGPKALRALARNMNFLGLIIIDGPEMVSCEDG